jgi:hypothetical protein
MFVLLLGASALDLLSIFTPRTDGSGKLTGLRCLLTRFSMGVWSGLTYPIFFLPTFSLQFNALAIL